MGKRRVAVIKNGAAEHPEELTDRCCLSALAGLSKYLPFFGTARHYTEISTYVNFSGYERQSFALGEKILHVYYLNKNSVVLVEHVDWWKKFFHGI